jgi:hypothetical protein
MGETKTNKELQVLQDIISSLSKLDKKTQTRIIQSILAFLGISSNEALRSIPLSSIVAESEEFQPSISSFSDREEMSPKEFILAKKPFTDVERIVCLAYYLTHYRNTRHFKTIDISKLNMEAAQIKFSNTTFAVQNATKKGFLVPSTKGNKQISAIGEQFVQALPDRESAKEVFKSLRKRRKSSPKRKTKSREKE